MDLAMCKLASSLLCNKSPEGYHSYANTCGTAIQTEHWKILHELVKYNYIAIFQDLPQLLCGTFGEIRILKR